MSIQREKIKDKQQEQNSREVRQFGYAEPSLSPGGSCSIGNRAVAGSLLLSYAKVATVYRTGEVDQYNSIAYNWTIH